MCHFACLMSADAKKNCNSLTTPMNKIVFNFRFPAQAGRAIGVISSLDIITFHSVGVTVMTIMEVITNWVLVEVTQSFRLQDTREH